MVLQSCLRPVTGAQPSRRSVHESRPLASSHSTDTAATTLSSSSSSPPFTSSLSSPSPAGPFASSSSNRAPSRAPSFEDPFIARHTVSGPIERSAAFLPLSFARDSVSGPLDRTSKPSGFLPAGYRAPYPAAPYPTASASPIVGDSSSQRAAQGPVTSCAVTNSSTTATRAASTRSTATSGPIAQTRYRRSPVAQSTPLEGVASLSRRAASGPINPASSLNAIPQSYLTGLLFAHVSETAAPSSRATSADVRVTSSSGWEQPILRPALRSAGGAQQAQPRRLTSAASAAATLSSSLSHEVSSPGVHRRTTSQHHARRVCFADEVSASAGDAPAAVAGVNRPAAPAASPRETRKVSGALSVAVPRWMQIGAMGQSVTAFALPPPPLASSSPTCVTPPALYASSS
eukprot:TRINITY_DN6854_c0_g1_i1.p1 TRINITY_DN6854_c0_g1~~TRINITY_DN6854_c0_g1_i1.p1  ORF type:complete len:403 (+),score=-58.66 TRINITY_DN6854_c0_g1_i1:372-1580(+)